MNYRKTRGKDIHIIIRYVVFIFMYCVSHTDQILPKLATDRADMLWVCVYIYIYIYFFFFFADNLEINK
jgi:hypothetical protein